MLAGTLKPVEGSDKTFRTSYPYPQPPKYSFNYFTDNGLQNGNMDQVSLAGLNPPYFWYMWADGKYVPALADKYEIK